MIQDENFTVHESLMTTPGPQNKSKALIDEKAAELWKHKATWSYVNTEIIDSGIA